ncbi:hypothetical protein B0H19DRAFT_113816 [Mycena capillaripes]|nr:hypothetical protein B0H19DRAFT_113816 [Mycena capillaripes]
MDSRLVLHNNNPVVDEVAYRANREHLEKMQEFINAANAVNEQGKRNYDSFANELKRKIQEGEKAQLMLAALQQSQPLLTYHDSVPDASTSNFPLLSYPPAHVPSARIEEISSPERHPIAQQSTFYNQPQANHSASYQEQGRGYSEVSYQPYATQNGHMPTFNGAFGGQSQAHYRTTPPFMPQQTFQPSASHSYFQQSSRPSATQSYSQPNGHQVQLPPQPQVPSRSHPPTTVNPAQLQSQSQPHLASDQRMPRMSQPRENPPAAVPRPASNPPPQNAQRHSPQSGPSAPSVQLHQPAQTQTQTPPLPPTQSNSRPQPPVPPPTQSSSRPSQTSVTPIQIIPSQQSQQSQTLQPPGKNQNQPSVPPSQPPHKASDPAPTRSYGMSPFAHNPAPNAQPTPTPIVVPTQKVAISSAGPAPPAAKLTPSRDNTAPPATNGPLDPLHSFLSLINKWQKASPPKSYLDIPHAHIRVLKLPSGEIHFYCPDPKTNGAVLRISPATAFARTNFLGSAGIFVNPKGVNVLLQTPLPLAMKVTHKVFSGAPVKDAPNASYTDPPAPATAKRALPDGAAPRTPKDADKRFMAHDILRALGKVHMFAQDDDSVRYAKRRALEAPAPVQEPQPQPLVLRPIHSNESSAKTTPVSSRRTSPLPSVPVVVPLAAPRVPLFLPEPVSFARPEHRPPPTASKPNFCVLVPPAPPYVKRHQAKMRAQRELEKTTVQVDVDPVEAIQVDVAMREEEGEPHIDLVELKRRRQLGMYQNTQS